MVFLKNDGSELDGKDASYPNGDIEMNQKTHFAGLLEDIGESPRMYIRTNYGNWIMEDIYVDYVRVE